MNLLKLFYSLVSWLVSPNCQPNIFIPKGECLPNGGEWALTLVLLIITSIIISIIHFAYFLITFPRPGGNK